MEECELCQFCKHFINAECELGDTPVDEDECSRYEEEGYGEEWV